jgi:hypothetical protein
MKIRVLILLAIAFCGCVRADEGDADVSVSNIRVGLMHVDTDGQWRIYSVGNTFPLKPNGHCEVEGKIRECMWYGIEFDYTPPSATLTLNCTSGYNKQTDVFDPEREGWVKVETSSFEVSIDGSNGMMAMPAAVFSLPDDTQAPWTVEVVCGHDGQELLRYTFTALHEP